MKYWPFALGGAGLVLVLLLVFGLMWGQRALAPADPAGESVLFEVSPGESLGSIALRLEREGVVRNARAVVWLARWQELAGSLQTGEFRLSPADTPDQILARISEGRVETYEVSLPEGFTLSQIAERLDAAGLVDAAEFTRVARDPETAARLGVEGDTLEGYLFPETYRLPKGMTAEEVAEVLVEQLLVIWREIEPKAKAIDFSMKETVTLASIIEKETGAAKERPIIASVFHNRLRRGMRLETDPTVIYGIPDFDGNLKRRHLEDETNSYNTYRIFGLPPGPIASPGADALRAVVDPAETDYLYFVSKNDGTHVFSSRYTDHEDAVDRYQRRRSR